MRSSALCASLLLGLAATGCDIFGPRDSCFVRGTRVRTRGGDRPIEELAAGDEVLSLRTDDGAIVVRRIERVITACVDEVIVLHVGGEILVTTREHPFWDNERRRWAPAGTLEAGAVLVLLGEGGETSPAVVSRVDLESRPGTPVWNLTVEGPEHTYFAAGIAVHNKEPPCDHPDCFSRPRAPEPDVGDQIVATEHLLSDDVVIDAALFLATDRVPLSPQLSADAPTQGVTLSSSGALVRPLGVITLQTDDRSERVPGSILDLPNGERILVVGGAAMISRLAGKFIFERHEATTEILRIRPSDAYCPAAEPRLAWSLPADGLRGATLETESWNAAGCVALTTSAGAATACVQRDAWPFSPGDVLDGEPLAGPREGVTFSSATAVLSLERISSDDGQNVTTIGDLRIGIHEDMACTAVASTCGATLAGARAVGHGGGGDEVLDPAAPLADGDGGEHWVVAAYGAPVRLDSCDGPARAFVEVVSRRPR
jgi:hypothetical protein